MLSILTPTTSKNIDKIKEWQAKRYEFYFVNVFSSALQFKTIIFCFSENFIEITICIFCFNFNFFNFRVRFTKEQWQYMLEYFKINQRPNHEEKLAMSKHLGLSMCTIMIFFCNRRTRLATKGHFWRDFKVLFYLLLSHNDAFRNDHVRWMNKIPVKICD